MKLIDIYEEIILESIDIYSSKDLESKGIKYEIIKEDSKSLQIKIIYKDNPEVYWLTIDFKGGIHNFIFGIEENGSINVEKDVNKPYTSLIRAAIFGFLREYINKYNIKEFQYLVKDNFRVKLYTYYLEKYFDDFKLFKNIKLNDNTYQVIWKK